MKFGDLLVAIVVSISVAYLLSKCDQKNKNKSLHPVTLRVPHRESYTHHKGSKSHRLPTRCIGTQGGDSFICPCDGVCPDNGESCDPSSYYGLVIDPIGGGLVNGYIPCPCNNLFSDGEVCQGSSFTPYRT